MVNPKNCERDLLSDTLLNGLEGKLDEALARLD